MSHCRSIGYINLLGENYDKKVIEWLHQDQDSMGLLQLRNNVVQNRHTGEQVTHWGMLKKATKFEFSLFNMSQCVICSIFVPCYRSAANGPFN